MSRILLGTHVYPAQNAAAQRMQRALSSWTKLEEVDLVNLQFANRSTTQAIDQFETQPLLKHDSCTVTGLPGPRKPIVSELLARLGQLAEARGCEYIGFSNADILISPTAIDRVLSSGRSGTIFSRMDIDGENGQPMGEFFSGQDTIFLKTATYRRHRRSLRPYVVGEMPWDVIYTSYFLSHTDVELVNFGADCRHVWHETIWVDSPFAPHGWRLAHLDWTYFARWYQYYEAAKQIRAAGRDADEEARVRQSIFGAPLRLTERLKNGYRSLRYGGVFTWRNHD